MPNFHQWQLVVLILYNSKLNIFGFSLIQHMLLEQILPFQRLEPAKVCHYCLLSKVNLSSTGKSFQQMEKLFPQIYSTLCFPAAIFSRIRLYIHDIWLVDSPLTAESRVHDSFYSGGHRQVRAQTLQSFLFDLLPLLV